MDLDPNQRPEEERSAEDVLADSVRPVINPTAPPLTIPVRVASSRRIDVLSRMDLLNLRVYFGLLDMTKHSPRLSQCLTRPEAAMRIPTARYELATSAVRENE